MRAVRLAAALLVIAACSNVATSDAGYGLSEGVVDGPSHLSVTAAGTIKIENYGDYTHTLVVTDDQGEVKGATDLIESGAKTSLALDLKPGTYVFSCRIVAQDDEGNLIDHYEGGMHRTVTVQS